MSSNIQIHLDLLGGISGNMFIAALIDARPECKDVALNAAESILPEVKINISKTSKNNIAGTYFLVEQCHKDVHSHRSFKDIKNIINNSKLHKDVKHRSVEIFKFLAEAESKIHDTDIEEIKFHEVGAWDSIVDNVTAASLIVYFEKKYNCQWSCGPIPIGEGYVKTQHGKLPVPAPATVLLLRGFSVTKDNILGERTTPTGAAILCSLKPMQNNNYFIKENMVISTQGIGIGSNTFESIPNILRVITFEKSEKNNQKLKKELISEINFDIDDQTPEDLALSIDKLRKVHGVLDVTQNPVLGKKGRVVIKVNVLCDLVRTNSIIDIIFNETSTIGLRQRLTDRYFLSRKIKKRLNYDIKESTNPSGLKKIKVESDNLKNYDFYERKSIKTKLEK